VEKNIGDSPQALPKNWRVCNNAQKRRARAIGCSGCNTADIGRSTGDCSHLGLSERMVGRALGANHRKSGRNIIKDFADDKAGDAVVEATILFPVMIMVFAALVLLAIYLPARAVLQRATGYAATALATESSDTWLFFNESSMSFYRQTDKRYLKNVYVDLFTKPADIQSKGESIVISAEGRSISSKAGVLSVESSVNNNILYKEVVITATREFPMPVDLSFIGFPQSISVTATSTATVQNADEFIRNIDMASDFAEFISEKYNLQNITESIRSFGSRITGLLGW